AVAFIFSSSNGTLHHDVGSLRQGTGVFRKFPERDDSMPIGTSVLLSISVLPGFFGRDRKCGDECSVLSVVRVGITAREADDGELIHCVHVSSPYLLPVVPGATEKIGRAS